MTDFIKFGHANMLREAVQSLLEAKKLARSLENTVDALIPVVASEEAAKLLEEVRESAARASGIFQRLYNKNAKEAFGSPEGHKASES